MLTRPKTGSKVLKWDTSATILQHGIPRASPDTVMEDSSTSEFRTLSPKI